MARAFHAQRSHPPVDAEDEPEGRHHIPRNQDVHGDLRCERLVSVHSIFLAKPGDPSEFGLSLFAEEGDDLSGEWAEFDFMLQIAENVRAGAKRVFTQTQNPIAIEKLRGNVHFFVGDLDILQEFISIGFTVSFTGVITFARDYDEIVQTAPLNMIMSETDAPWVQI